MTAADFTLHRMIRELAARVAALEADTDEAKQTRVQETLRAADKQMADAVKAKRDTLKREDE